MIQSTQQLYARYVAITQKAADFNGAAAVLGWDQEVYMPEGGAGTRARQLSTLATTAHELLTSTEYGAVLQDLAAKDGLTAVETANIMRSLQDYERNTKLPANFVAELSEQTSVCFQAWAAARTSNNFATYAPHLERMIALKKRQADLVGYEGHPYNALVDEYEPGANVKMLDALFSTIGEEIKPLTARISSCTQVDDTCLHQHFDRQSQWDFSIKVLQLMGYDFKRGRQDYAPHPFTTSFGANDVRVTTRVDEQNFGYMLWSTIHEGGHALYEQGLPQSQYGLPVGSAASLGVHESQSRLWENCIGRSGWLWLKLYPELQSTFPSQLGRVSFETFYRAINRVAPSFIRTEADELTYHFHVKVRYEIEKQLIAEPTNIMELPALWNSLYQEYLGITPESDTVGVLQDVHWAHGSFGYFPTYSLGSLYAAQYYQYAMQQMPDIANAMQQANFEPMLRWLREHIHGYGRTFTAEELCKRITGESLNVTHFIRYATEKYDSIYH
jgi:carboxypeptidase Taq